MIQVIYTSRAKAPFSVEALRDLLAKARRRNTERGVSGMLLHVEGSFLQVLEGEAGPVQALYDLIGRDPRHTGVILLARRTIDARCFADWSMAFFDASGRARGLVGYRATNGFADLAGDPAALIRIIDDFRAGRWRSLAA